MDFTLIFGAIAVVGLILLLFIFGIRKPSYLLFLLVLFLPFERIPTFEFNDFTVKINHIIGLIVIFSSFYIIGSNRKRISRKSYLIIGLIIGLIGSFFASMLGAELLGRSLIFSLQAIFVMLLCLATYILVNKQNLVLIEKAILIAGWIVIIFGLWQFFGDLIGLPISVTGLIEGYSKITFGFPRVQAFSKEPLYLGNYLFLPLGLGVAGLLYGKNQKLYLTFTAGIILILLLTISRGAYIALAVFGLVLAIQYPKKVATVRNIALALVSVIVIGGLVYGVISYLGGDTKDRFIDQVTIKDLGTSESTVSRLSASQLAFQAWQENPVFGIGPGNYGGYTNGYDVDDPKINDIVNNEYSELLAENGIVGVGLFGILIIFVIGRAIRSLQILSDSKEKFLVTSLTAALVAMLVQYIFFSTFAIIHIWVTIGLLLAIQKIAMKDDFYHANK